jgi:hypothetical protein
MKTVYAHALAFGMMTGICFVAFSGLALFFPLLSAFIAWDWTPLTFGWSITFLCMRIIFLASTLIGVLFVCSKEGQDMVKDIMNG